MTHHAKASSAGSTEGGGNSRGLFRRAFATRGASSDAKGSGARSNGRLRATLAVLALAIAAFAITAAPANAVPPSTTMGAVSAVSYSSAHVNGRVTTTGGLFKNTNYSFEYSKNPATEGWTPGPAGGLGGAQTNERVEGDIIGLRGGTKYFVRLVATVFGPGFVMEEGVSPEPNAEFTTLVVDPPENVSLSTPAEVFSITAKLSGKVKRPTNANAAFDVKCRFEYISDELFNENITNIGSGAGFDGATPAPCEPTPITEAGVEKVVTAKLSGLTAATTYHQRLVAETASPQIITTAATTFTTGPAVEKPKVLSVNTPTSISYRAVKVSGEIERPAGTDPALNTNCHFEYVTEKQFEETGFDVPSGVPCDQTPVDGAGTPTLLTNPGPTPVTATFDLDSGVTYHYRLSADNAAGVDTKTAASTFTTLPGGEPTFSIDPNPVVGYTSFKLFGSVTYGLGAEDEEINYEFEIAEVGTENWNGCCQLVQGTPHGSGPQPISFEYTAGHGIKPDTEYKYRIILQRRGSGVYETSPEPYPTVKTKALAEPGVAFGPVTGVTADAAHFSGSVDTNAPAGPLDDLAKAAFKTDWEFQCTPECPGNSGTVQGEEGNKAISLDALELDPNTFYEAKLVAHNVFYTVESPVQTFQTPLVAPTVTSTPGSSDGQGGYFLEGIVNSNNTKITSCKFEYGTTATYPNTYEAPCLPNPSGPNEVQLVTVDATEGQFKLSFRGQTTADLPYNATPAEVQTALRALSQVGSTGVNVTGTAQAYKVTFAGGGVAGSNVSPIKGSDGTTPLGGGAGVSVSTETEGGNSRPVSVEAHLEALTVGSTYHFRIFATSAGGTVSTVDRTFIPEVPSKEACANEQQRQENSSLALPECRAYEMVSPPGKEGFPASLVTYDAGDRVGYKTGAGNIANSGQHTTGSNFYLTARSSAGWVTVPGLNGSAGSLYSPPSNVLRDLGADYPIAFSPDLRSAIWYLTTTDCTRCEYLRSPDGGFELIGSALSVIGLSAGVASSADLTHLVTWGDGGHSSQWGLGVYEFLGTGMDQPRRVDLDNSGAPISSCAVGGSSSVNRSVSNDGSRIVNYVYGACGGANPPAGELWARINGTTSVDVSASQCNRTAADPGGACNGPAEAGGCVERVNGAAIPEAIGCRRPQFVAATPDGSRVFFTTTQQLVNGDTDQTNDIYACDLPSGNPAPGAGKANPCSAFRQISAGQTGAAEVENVLTTSDNGDTVLFTAKGVLADNEDALGEKALAGDHNLYVWRQSSAHPTGQTAFLGRLASSDISDAQDTPDGRYVVFTTANQLVETDTDSARDVYRVDAETGELTRVSTNVLGIGGNGPFDARINVATALNFVDFPAPAVSDDGQKIVFTTVEALSPLDGNGEVDVYLWTPARGSLITTGSSGYPLKDPQSQILWPSATISGSGHDIYFESAQPLTPADGDDIGDVYNARIGGGFSFVEAAGCAGEGCQPPPPAPPSTPLSPANRPNGEGNVVPKTCPKGKVLKGSKCVKKKHKKHSGKKHHGKKASHKQGGGK